MQEIGATGGTDYLITLGIGIVVIVVVLFFVFRKKK